MANTLCRLQVHGSITHHLYIVLCVLHHKSSLLPSPSIPRLFPSTSFYPFALIITLIVSMSFFNCLIPSPFSPTPSTTLPSNSYQSSICIYESVSIFCLFILFIRFHTQVKSCGICLSLSDLFLFCSIDLYVCF